MKKSNSSTVAVITGAGRGNGRATAFHLGKSGISLYLSDLDSGLLEETISDLKSEGIDATGGIYDASKISDARVPITVRHARIMTMEPARYIS